MAEMKYDLKRMDRLELVTLLERVTTEHDAMRQRCADLEEANAKLALSARELELQRDSLMGALASARQRLMAIQQPGVEYPPVAAAEAPAEEHFAAVEEQAAPAETDAPVTLPADLPLGSFAEAMVQVQQIVTRTQQAADDYMAQCRAQCSDGQAEAERLIAEARAQAEALLADAREESRRLAERDQQVRETLRQEMARLNGLMQSIRDAAGE